MICRSLKECLIVDSRVKNPSQSIAKSVELCMLNSGFLAVALFRVAQFLYQKKIFWRISAYLTRLNIFLTGFECHISAVIDVGLFVPHAQNIVIGAGVRIGKNVTIYNGVTIGAKKRTSSDIPTESRYPIIESNVEIYTGAKILGPILIGKNVAIGANSVVLKNVPEGRTAIGIPAKVI